MRTRRFPVPLLLGVLAGTPPACAATFIVDTTADAVDAAPGDGACATGAGTCTLRAAIQEMLDHDGPFVLDVIVPYTEHVLPMIPAGRTVKDMLLK